MNATSELLDQLYSELHVITEKILINQQDELRLRIEIEEEHERLRLIEKLKEAL